MLQINEHWVCLTYIVAIKKIMTNFSKIDIESFNSASHHSNPLSMEKI